MLCKRVITMSSVSTHYHTCTFFSCDENFKNLLSQKLSNIQYSITTVTMLYINDILRTYLFYNWNFVLLSMSSFLKSLNQHEFCSILTPFGKEYSFGKGMISETWFLSHKQQMFSLCFQHLMNPWNLRHKLSPSRTHTQPAGIFPLLLLLLPLTFVFLSACLFFQPPRQLF